ncbi:protein of unknown function [Methylocaldum szegediense]|uniref:Uncharacterized protein n=1 Tax=Methylocaldum szegediense TaxID=73780 RepID=A0ABM9HX16_9GAMM|nr:protein of unknown function [Methylocaldum szegediense]
MPSNNPAQIPLVEADAFDIVKVEPKIPRVLDRFRAELCGRHRRAFGNGFRDRPAALSIGLKNQLRGDEMKIDKIAALQSPYHVCHISDNPLARNIPRRAGLRRGMPCQSRLA